MATQNKSGQKPVQKLKETSVAAGRFPFRAATIFAPVFEQTCLRSVTGSWSNLKDAPNRSVNIALRCSSAHTGVRSDNQLQQMFNLNRIHVQLEWNPCCLVHHATIFEMNAESYRRRQAIDNTSRKKTAQSNTGN